VNVVVQDHRADKGDDQAHQPDAEEGGEALPVAAQDFLDLAR
jgi:hypothetical protein